MADLAKSELPRSGRRRLSDNADFTMPARRDTSKPGVEVNAPIVGPNQSRAAALLDILKVGQEAADQGLALLDEKAAEQRTADRAAGATADQAGKPDEAKLAKSRAYAQGYYLSGAQRTVISLESQVRDAVNARLNDTSQDPATPEDINKIINDHFASVALNEDGTPRNLGDPLAQKAMANGLAQIRANLVPDALAKIKDQTDDHLIDNLMFNVAHGVGLKPLDPATNPKLALAGTGVPVPGAIKSIDPNTGLADSKPGAVAKPSTMRLVTGKLPLNGTITSTYKQHEARGSHGLDIDGSKGDPVEAPAAGKVIKSGYDAKSGNFLMIDHGNGVVSSYSHLDKRYFKPGQVIQAGDTLGTVGNSGHVVSETGDGSHLHYRVRVNGKDVDPQSFKFQGVQAPDGGDTPISPVEDASPIAPTPYDFEALMAQKPPGMDPKVFKTKAIDALAIYADEAKRPDILEGMAMSVRKDGTPSFSPEEILKLRATADSMRNRQYEEAQRIKNQRYSDNLDQLLKGFATDNPPTISTIQDWVRADRISPQHGYTLIKGIEAEQHSQEIEAHALAREAKQDADREADDYATAEIIRRTYGDTSGPDPLDLFNQGKLGEGKHGLANLMKLRSANAAGAEYQSKTPEGATAAQMLELQFPKPEGGDANSFAALTGTGGTNARLRAAAFSAWQEKLKAGVKPFDAAQQVIKEYAPFKNSKNEEDYLKAARSSLLVKNAKP